MMPMLPPSHLDELAREHLGGHARLHAARANDPDGFLGADAALPPDPVYMALRRLMTTGPIGAVRAWIAARDDRRYEEASHDALDRAGTSRLPAIGAESTAADDADPRIAA